MSSLRKYLITFEARADFSQPEQATNKYVAQARGGAQAAGRAWDGINAHVRGHAAIIDNATTAVKSYFAIMAAQAAPRVLIEYANAWQDIGNRLRIVTTSTAQFQQAQSAVYRIAKETHQPLAATAELYQRITQYSGQLGLTSAKTAAVVDTVAKAVALSGASSVTAEQGIRQLAQGLASGTLRGQDLRAVLDDLPGVTQALTTGLGVSVGELRKMSAAGELTAQQVIQAFQNAASQTDAAFSKFHRTIAMSFTDLQTETIHYIGTLDNAYHASAVFGDAIEAVGKNLNVVAGLVGSIGAYKLASLFGTATASAIDYTKALYGNIAGLKASIATANEKAMADMVVADRAMVAADAKLADRDATLLEAKANAEAAMTTLQKARSDVTAATTAEERAVAQKALTEAEIGAAAADKALGKATVGQAAASRAAKVATNTLSVANKEAAASAGVLSVAARGVKAALGGWVGIISIVASVVAGFALFSSTADDASKSALDLSQSVDELKKSYLKLGVAERAASIVKAADDAADSRKKAIDDLTDAVRTYRRALADSGHDEQSYKFVTQARELQAAYASGKIGADALTDALFKLMRANNGVADRLKYRRDEAITSAGAFQTNARAAENNSEKIKALKSLGDQAAASTKTLTGAMADQANQLGLSGDKLQTYLEGLQDQVGKVGLSAKALAEYEARAKGANAQQAQMAGTMSDQVSGWKKYQEAVAKGDKAGADSTLATLTNLTQIQIKAESVVRATQALAELPEKIKTLTAQIAAANQSGDLVGANGLQNQLIVAQNAKHKAETVVNGSGVYNDIGVRLHAADFAHMAGIDTTPPKKNNAGGGSGAANNYQQQKNAIAQLIAEQNLLTASIRQYGAASDQLTEGQKRVLAIDLALKQSQDQRTGAYKGLTNAELAGLRVKAQDLAADEKKNAALAKNAQLLQMIKNLDQQGASELANRNRKNAADIAALSMGDQARTRNSRIDAIYDNYVKREQDAVDRIAAARLAGDAKGVADSQKYYDALERQRGADLKSEARYQKELDAARGDYKVGMDRAVSNYIEQAADIAGQTESMFNNAFGGMTDALVNFVTTGKLNFKDLANSIIADLVRMETRILISKALEMIFGGSTYTGTMPDESYAASGVNWNVSLGQANGGVWDGGVQMFARGGIVSSPTLFKFASGTGLMGEAGPEAIIPLARGSNGKLGIEAHGMGGGGGALQVEVNITNRGDPVQAKQTGQRQDGNKVIIDMIIDTISGDVAGGGKTAKAIQGRYGLARRGVPVGG